MVQCVVLLQDDFEDILGRDEFGENEVVKVFDKTCILRLGMPSERVQISTVRFRFNITDRQQPIHCNKIGSPNPIELSRFLCERDGISAEFNK